MGVDIFIEWADAKPKDIAECVLKCEVNNLKLKMVSNRGIAVWPETLDEVFCVDHYRCRFMAENTVNPQEIVDLLASLHAQGIEFIKTENLYTFDGAVGFSG